MTFDPKEKLSKIQGKDYLEVKWRIVWFREEHPEGSIITEVLSYEPEVIQASVIDSNVVLGTGIGTPKKQGVASSRPFEGAETAAIGRALAHAGYGTQFTGEDEAEHLADAPVETPKQERPYSAVLTKAKILELSGKHQLKKKKLTDKQDKAFIITYASIFPDDNSRYAVTEFLFGSTSSKHLEAHEKLAMIDWMSWEEVEGKMLPSQHAVSEAQIMLRHCEAEQGQKELL